MTLTHRIAVQSRCRSLRQLLNTNRPVRIIEAHSGISALVGQQAGFDGFWISSLTSSAVRGLPDTEVVDNTTRLSLIDEVCDVTSKPIIVDGDTGGSLDQFGHFVCGLERRGVSAVIVEDKVFPKRNSLVDGGQQTLEDPQVFGQKITRGKEVSVTSDFMVIARLESLIAGVGIGDALRRAHTYIDAGADGIMIHSKDTSPESILQFATMYRKHFDLPLVAVPTTYNKVIDKTLADYGFDIVIYANHLLRASHAAMVAAAQMILVCGRGFEVEALCTPVGDIFKLVGLT